MMVEHIEEKKGIDKKEQERTRQQNAKDAGTDKWEATENRNFGSKMQESTRTATDYDKIRQKKTK